MSDHLFSVMSFACGVTLFIHGITGGVTWYVGFACGFAAVLCIKESWEFHKRGGAR